MHLRIAGRLLTATAMAPIAPFSRIEPVRGADSRSAAGDRRNAAGADHRRVSEELRAKGITRLTPRFHLSTEWGVPFGTVVIGIPFYLARPELTGAARRGSGAHRRAEPGRHSPLSAARDGARRQLRLQALRRRRVGEAVRLDHAAVSGGLSPAAVQPAVRPASARLVRAEASRRGLGRDVCRLDDAGRDWRANMPSGRGAGQAGVSATARCSGSASRIRRSPPPIWTKMWAS